MILYQRTKKLYLGYQDQNAPEVVCEELVAADKNDIELGVANMVSSRVSDGCNSITNVETTNTTWKVEDKAQSSKVATDEVQDTVNRKIEEIERARDRKLDLKIGRLDRRLKTLETEIEKINEILSCRSNKNKNEGRNSRFNDVI